MRNIQKHVENLPRNFKWLSIMLLEHNCNRKRGKYSNEPIIKWNIASITIKLYNAIFIMLIILYWMVQFFFHFDSFSLIFISVRCCWLSRRYAKKSNVNNNKICKKFDRIAPANHVCRKPKHQSNGAVAHNGIGQHTPKVSVNSRFRHPFFSYHRSLLSFSTSSSS